MWGRSIIDSRSLDDDGGARGGGSADARMERELLWGSLRRLSPRLVLQDSGSCAGSRGARVGEMDRAS